MDQLNSHKIAFFIQSIRTHHNYLIKLTPLLVSLSLFPFIFSTSSLISFLHHFNFYFSTFPFQLFTHTIDKNCIFLLCNGLLVFVGITRSLSSGTSSVDESSNNVEYSSQLLYSTIEAKVPVLVVKEKTTELKEVSDEAEKQFKDINLKERKRSSILVLEQEEKPKQESRLFDERDEDKDSGKEDVLEEANWVLNTDELNKRFDDFIKRMKEDLRIEAQRQFVMV
ncbi:unnamed protein product [Vicia faba]|uniref:Uncharacterized protein n=1 Tax=Vicia faba TaxID=3906 RepID=A0AAV0YFN9_VICFA|nr:unnamed protein product [Vicia faba]